MRLGLDACAGTAVTLLQFAPSPPRPDAPDRIEWSAWLWQSQQKIVAAFALRIIYAVHSTACLYLRRNAARVTELKSMEPFSGHFFR